MVDVWKKITVTNQDDGIVSEPECVYGDGIWVGTSCGSPYAPQNNIASVIRYDMNVNGDPIIKEADGYTV